MSWELPLLLPLDMAENMDTAGHSASFLTPGLLIGGLLIAARSWILQTSSFFQNILLNSKTFEIVLFPSKQFFFLQKHSLPSKQISKQFQPLNLKIIALQPKESTFHGSTFILYTTGPFTAAHYSLCSRACASFFIICTFHS